MKTINFLDCNFCQLEKEIRVKLRNKPFAIYKTNDNNGFINFQDDITTEEFTYVQEILKEHKPDWTDQVNKQKEKEILARFNTYRFVWKALTSEEKDLILQDLVNLAILRS